MIKYILYTFFIQNFQANGNNVSTYFTSQGLHTKKKNYNNKNKK